MSSRRYFVHIDEPYYPSGHIVDAPNERAAIAKAWEAAGHRGPDDEDRVAIVVVPLSRVRFFGELDQVQDMDADADRYDPDTWRHYETEPLPVGIYQKPDPISDAIYRSAFHRMATFASIDLTPPAAPSGFQFGDPLDGPER